VLFGCERLAAGRGGISRVARLMARALGDAATAGKVSVNCASLSDEGDVREFPFPVAAQGGSRARFLFHVLRGLRHADLAIYDFAGTARAHVRWFGHRVPSLTMIHGIEVWEQAMPHHLKSCRQATFLLANSAFTRDKANRIHGGFARARVCWLATEEDEPVVVKGERKLQIFIVGRMQNGRDKGHSALIDAMPQVVARVPSARLIIVGAGDTCDVLKHQASASAAKSAIEFRGFVPEQEIKELWAESAVFAMPSYGEGFGLVYIEAMRYGLPVVASTLDAATEINLHGQTGYNVDPRDVPSLSNVLVALLDSPVKAREMGAAGQRHWSAHFRYSAFRERFLQQLQQVLNDDTNGALLNLP